MNQPDMFAPLAYPNVPGARANECSRAAADEIKGRAETLRAAVLNLLQDASLTADEAAAKLRESVLSIRPRFSELVAKGLIFNTGKKRINASGAKATVWRAVGHG